MKFKKQLFALFLIFPIITVWLASSVMAANEAPLGMSDGEPPVGGMGGPPGQGVNSTSTTKVSTVDGDWSFDIITTTSGTTKTVTSTITYYSGKTDEVIVVPSVLVGASVTKISAQAFGHHSEIMAVYVPNSVTEIADWAFYDLNTAVILSFANPNVSIDNAAFQSSGNAVLYLPEGTTGTSRGGKAVVTENTEIISVSLENTAAAAIAGGTYLNVTNSERYGITAQDVASIAQSASKKASDVNSTNTTVRFTGDNYVAAEQKIEIYKDFVNDVSADELNKTFRSLTTEEAVALNKAIADDSSYSNIKSLFSFEEGYYLNGNKIDLGERITIDEETGKFPSTGNGYYKYVTYRDTLNDGDIDILYYSPYSRTY